MVRPGGAGQGSIDLRRSGAQRQDHVYGAVFLLLGHADLPWSGIRPVRQDGHRPAAQFAGRAAAGIEGVGLSVGGEGVQKSDYRPLWRTGEYLLPLRRKGRGERRPDSGHYPGGGAAGRGGPHAPVLRGTGLRALFRGGEQDVVLLQPGGAGALVLQGVDPEEGGTQCPLPPLYHAGQSGPLPQGYPALCPQLQRRVLPPVCAGRVGGGRGTGVRLF